MGQEEDESKAEAEAEDGDGGEDEDKDGGEDGDEDEDEDEDDDETDCYTLDLSTTTIGLKLWVRKEYIKIYDVCDKYLKSATNEDGPLSVVITGQPGVGKSYWIFYALHRCLCEGKPVIWYYDSKRYLFVAEGVYELSRDFPSVGFKTRVWTLVDTDEDKSGIPPYLAVQFTKHFIIYTSSPQRSRWDRLDKTTVLKVIIMNPWTRAELSKAAPIYGLEHDDPDVDEMFNRFGPTPRICFKFLKFGHLLSRHEVNFEIALGELSSRRLQDMVTGIRKFGMDNVPHTIFLVRRQKVNSKGDWGNPSVGPITDTVRIALRNQLQRERRDEQLRLYRSMADVKGTRRIAGVVFESLAHSKILQGVELTLFPMVNRRTSRGKTSPWHSNHGDSADPSSARQINIVPTEGELYPTIPTQIKNDVYYLPEAENQVAFDSFIKSGTELYIFQFSIASKHEIKRGITSFFKQESLPSQANWHFVFVVPTRSQSISCPQPQDHGLKALLNNMHLFSAVLDIEVE
ncbi:hypothetical protein EDB85DRAFT_1861243 [Lactarius pseudohatsudake]|nr:hypothetical protein EDB85DRAFT_1861243 [Lactarius pseudohatsudake]